MSLNFSTVEQASSLSGVKMMVYSPAGMGKTVLVATLPTPIMLSAESGVLSLRKRNLEKLFGVGNPDICYNVPIIQVTTVNELSEAYEWLIRSAEAKQFESVAIDSISEIAEVVLNNAKRQVKDPRQAYGELIEKMESTIRAYRDLPGKNVYMAAKQEPMKDELTGVVKYGPAMPGSKLGAKLPYFFDEVLRLAVNKSPQGESYRYLQTQPDLQYECKDRSGALDVMEPPSLKHIIGKILAS